MGVRLCVGEPLEAKRLPICTGIMRRLWGWLGRASVASSELSSELPRTGAAWHRLRTRSQSRVTSHNLTQRRRPSAARGCSPAAHHVGKHVPALAHTVWAPAVARSVNWGHSTTSSCAMPPRCAMPPPEHSRDTVRARCSAEAAASAGPHCPGSRLAARPGPASRAFTQDSFELKVLETTLLAWHSGVLPPVSQSQTQSVLGLFHD